MVEEIKTLMVSISQCENQILMQSYYIGQYLIKLQDEKKTLGKILKKKMLGDGFSKGMVYLYIKIYKLCKRYKKLLSCSISKNFLNKYISVVSDICDDDPGFWRK